MYVLISCHSTFGQGDNIRMYVHLTYSQAKSLYEMNWGHHATDMYVHT